jgi:quercetin dioxygenase-like cupin family protein
MTMKRTAIFLGPGGGRAYPMGRISSVFKADGEETAGTYSVSEWWLDANTKGPPAHTQDDDHAWYVLEGTMSVQVDTEWFEAAKGAFILIPGGLLHTFENRTQDRAGLLSFNNSAGFEAEMPEISGWLLANPPGNAV